MKGKLKKIYKFLVGFIQSLVSFSLVTMFSRRCDWRKSDDFSSIALVFGNGPSLAIDVMEIVQISKVICADIWVVNNFALTKEFCEIRPNYYVLADPNYWRDDVTQGLVISRQRLIDALNTKVKWPMQLLLPFDAKGAKALDGVRSKMISVSFYNSTPVSGFSHFRHWFYNCGLGMPAPLNVLIAAASLATIKGYERIYIAGADHSWHEELVISEAGRPLVTQKHFYNESVTPRPVFKEGNEEFSIGDLFLRWGEVFKLYEVLRIYAESKGVKIFNISSKTYIDAFDRGGVDLLLEGDDK